jgi:hypothetical protein
VLIALAVAAGALWLGCGFVSTFRWTLRTNANGMVTGWGSLLGEILWATLCGLAGSVAGPLPALLRGWSGRTRRDPHAVAVTLGGESPDEKLARREQEVQQREERIAQLERDLL